MTGKITKPYIFSITEMKKPRFTSSHGTPYCILKGLIISLNLEKGGLIKYMSDKLSKKDTFVPQEVIENKILFIRGKKVMLDRDLAMLYGVETRMLNQAVRRNIKRFPEDFMFQLTKEETDKLLRSQFVVIFKIIFIPEHRNKIS
jgi:hypothetical protein